MAQHKPMPTKAQIMRFIEAVRQTSPDFERIRMTRDGDLEAERADGVEIRGHNLDMIDLAKR